jgi:hypothetical protein
VLASPFKSASRLEGENTALRHQLIGIVTLLKNMRTNLMGQQPSRDSDSFMPRLHGRGSEGTMRLG